jgi:hypothetical protein
MFVFPQDGITDLVFGGEQQDPGRSDDASVDFTEMFCGDGRFMNPDQLFRTFYPNTNRPSFSSAQLSSEAWTRRGNKSKRKPTLDDRPDILQPFLAIQTLQNLAPQLAHIQPHLAPKPPSGYAQHPAQPSRIIHGHPFLQPRYQLGLLKRGDDSMTDETQYQIPRREIQSG